MRAAADLGRQGPRVLPDHGTEVTIPQVKPLYRLFGGRDPSTTAGREMTGHTGLTAGLGAIGGAFGPAASMIFGQAKSPARHQGHPHSQHSAGS